MKAKKVFVGVSPSCLGRAMVASFLSISGRLRRPSLAQNVLYVIRKYAKIPRRYLGIAMIRGSVYYHLRILNDHREKAS